MYLVTFDKSGDSLSGWHYAKLREFEAKWIQGSVVKLNDLSEAKGFAEKLHEFGVQNVKIFLVADLAKSEVYVGT